MFEKMTTIKLLVMKKAYLLILFLVMLVSCNCNSQQHTSEKFINTEIVRPMANNKSNLGIGETLNFDLVFYRNDSIFFYDYQTNKINFIIEGSQPCLSNDGRKIAYTKTQIDTLTQKLIRRIMIFDLISNQSFSLNIDSQNHYNPMWSSSGKFLIFSIYYHNKWEIGIIGAENINFKILSDEISQNVFSPSWGRDDNTIVFHDMYKIYLVTRDGIVKHTYDIGQIDNNELAISSSSKFLVSTESDLIVFDATYRSEDIVYDPETPIFIYDITKKNYRRITPPNTSCTNLFLMNNNKLLFSGKESGTDVWNIYEISIEGGGLRLLIRDAMSPSSKSN
jgi:Tol biopolymer transport system component